MITRIKIENFRCLKNVEVKLNKFNVLVGPNDSGKSSFLDAFELLPQIHPIETLRSFSSSFNFQTNVWKNDTEADICIYAEIGSGNSYNLILTHDYNGFLIHPSLSIDQKRIFGPWFLEEDIGDPMLLLSSLQNDDTPLAKHIYSKIKKADLEISRANLARELNKIIQAGSLGDIDPKCYSQAFSSNLTKLFINLIRQDIPAINRFILENAYSKIIKKVIWADFYRLENIQETITKLREGYLGKTEQRIWSSLVNVKKHTFLADDIRKIPPVKPNIQPFTQYNEVTPTGLGLAYYLASLKLGNYKLFRQIENTLKSIIPRIEEVNIRLERGQITFTNADTGIEIPASTTSDGVLILLAYLTLLYSPSPPSLILVEEPENGVHPHRLETIVSLLKKLSQTEINGHEVQVIITTHSPYLLDYVEPEEILVFNRGKDGATVIKPLVESPIFKEKRSDYLWGELWASFGEEALINGPQQNDGEDK